MNMALTRDFRETVQARVKRDAAFRKGLLSEAIESLLFGEVTALRTKGRPLSQGTKRTVSAALSH